MKKQKKLLLLKLFLIVFALIFTLSSCEGNVDYKGVIYDAKSKEPIDGVKCIIVAFKNDNYYTYSDSMGNYYVTTPLVGCVPNCGKYDVEFSKEGYKTQIVEAPIDIYLERE